MAMMSTDATGSGGSYSTKVYECQICHQAFLTQKEALEHISKDHFDLVFGAKQK